MKLIICILQDSDKDEVSKALTENSWRVTQLPSTGAYFRRGNATLLIGVEDKQVKPAIKVIRENCAEPSEPGLKRATIFVLDVDRFEQV
ncbi:MAG: cyclic-di-AMP receptor [Anaerolineae bacterium]|nr:cyclic-di-AMP receptor [Anaerolineae bacterium]